MATSLSNNTTSRQSDRVRDYEQTLNLMLKRECERCNEIMAN